jgi:hypothetical protein
VRESDGTLILTWGLPKGGTALTIKFAQKHRKPHCVVDLSVGGDPKRVKEWGKMNRIEVLNVAGPPESNAPGIHDQAVKFLQNLLS